MTAQPACLHMALAEAALLSSGTGLLNPKDRALYAAIQKCERSRRLVAAKMFRTKGPSPDWIKGVWVQRAAAVRALVA